MEPVYHFCTAGRLVLWFSEPAGVCFAPRTAPAAVLAAAEASKAEALQTGALTFQVSKRVVDPDIVGFEESIYLVAGFKAKQPPKIGFRKMALPVFRRYQGL
jgi:hypothetical protein